MQIRDAILILASLGLSNVAFVRSFGFNYKLIQGRSPCIDLCSRRNI